jgi:hypothetical protein
MKRRAVGVDMTSRDSVQHWIDPTRNHMANILVGNFPDVWDKGQFGALGSGESPDGNLWRSTHTQLIPRGNHARVGRCIEFHLRCTSLHAHEML